MEENLKQNYSEKVEHLIDSLDFNKLAEIKRKELKSLTDDDLFSSASIK